MKRGRGRPVGSRDLRGRCVRVSLADASKQSRVKVARSLRRVLAEQGVSVNELACACGLTPREVHRISAGLVDVSSGRLRQLAAALGVPLAHLLG